MSLRPWPCRTAQGVAPVAPNGPTVVDAMSQRPWVTGLAEKVAVAVRAAVEPMSGSPLNVLVSNWIGSVPDVAAATLSEVVPVGTT